MLFTTDLLVMFPKKQIVHGFIQEANRIYKEEGIVNHFFIKYDINHPNENRHDLIAIKLILYIRNFYLNNN
jgi:hypothetical protein